MRRAALIVGGLVLAGVWAGPLRWWAPGPFSAHMTMHMGVVAVAAPLLALGIAGGRFDPVRTMPRALGPITASLVELVIVWGWHMPALHHVARHSFAGVVIEQITFLISGLWVWLAVLGGDPGQRRGRAGAAVVALLLTSMHMTLLGALLALPPRVLYGHGSLADQHLGGAIMLIFGGAVYLLGGVAVGARLVRGGLREGGVAMAESAEVVMVERAEVVVASGPRSSGGGLARSNEDDGVGVAAAAFGTSGRGRSDEGDGVGVEATTTFGSSGDGVVGAEAAVAFGSSGGGDGGERVAGASASGDGDGRANEREDVGRASASGSLGDGDCRVVFWEGWS